MTALLILSLGTARAELPEVLTDSAEMADLLERIAEADPRFKLETIGQSVEGKDLLAIRVSPKTRMAIRGKVLLIGAQHGHEHAGKEAILELLGDLASGEEQLPPGVELWAVPMANPDGVDKDQRRNANDFDLNRDHLILSQPETIALHKLVQRERPNIIVDCHEFTRDSKSYTDKGWGEWPLIMMDGANSPLLPMPQLQVQQLAHDRAMQRMSDAGINYQRYVVGGPPPNAELRYSTLDPDDARNGLSFYGGLGFIIESGIHRSADQPQADLDERIAAYSLLLDLFVKDELIAGFVNDQVTRLELHDRIPVNAMWTQWPPHYSREPPKQPLPARDYPVIDLNTGETLQVPAYNFASFIAVKKYVTKPAVYAVLPEHADAYAELLDRHAVRYDRLETTRTVTAETAYLERIEDDFDPIYERYGGRQIVRVEAEAAFDLPAGSLWIDLQELASGRPMRAEPKPDLTIPPLNELAQAEPMMARRAIKVLEPQQLYGLYQWPQWVATVGEDGRIPVVRVMSTD
ncbi:MAG: M14 family zinc carboxypeptidase [Planctomycetota bacterium]